MADPTKTKRDWVALILTIVPGLLGSGLIATLLGSFVSDLSKPNVQIQIIPDYNN